MALAAGCGRQVEDTSDVELLHYYMLLDDWGLGVQLGMTKGEVRSVLGKPIFENDCFLYYGYYVLDKGNLALYFDESTSKCDSILVMGAQGDWFRYKLNFFGIPADQISPITLLAWLPDSYRSYYMVLDDMISIACQAPVHTVDDRDGNVISLNAIFTSDYKLYGFGVVEMSQREWEALCNW
jgi:hypothetical protein